jgi:enamine deaminase RidA (YjgF/YER057c/UK114 family)
MGGVRRIRSGAPWEPLFGYSRAVSVGPWTAISGTTSFDERGLIVGKNQMYVQARQALANIQAALSRAGLTFADVIRTRVFITDIGRFEEVARAHRECFGAYPPASTAVEVRRLAHPDMMVEIEADAWAESPAPNQKAAIANETAIVATGKHRRRKTASGRKPRTVPTAPGNPRKKRR